VLDGVVGGGAGERELGLADAHAELDAEREPLEREHLATVDLLLDTVAVLVAVLAGADQMRRDERERRREFAAEHFDRMLHNVARIATKATQRTNQTRQWQQAKRRRSRHLEKQEGDLKQTNHHLTNKNTLVLE
jgi:hypothetical protein